jgi:hypothetical protein
MTLRGRTGETLMAVAATLAVGWSALAACRVASTGLASGCNQAALTVTCNIVTVGVWSDGPFTLTVNGRTVQSSAVTPYATTVWADSIAPGTYDITGTTSADSLRIVLGALRSTTQGVVKRGSVASVSGPGTAIAGGCGIWYLLAAGATRPQAFRAQYTLITGTDGC